MRMDGKVALVTGAARGIGRATAEVLAELGADVGLFDIRDDVGNSAAAVRAHGRAVAHRIVDIADAGQVKAGVEAVESELGPVDILVNNAGIVNNIAPLARMSQDAWQHELDVNLTGPFNLIQAIVPGMAERGWGRIVNVSSIAARGGLYKQVGYASTKAGILGLTRTVTLEYANRGVTCNAILPGIIGTENVRAMPAEILAQAIEMTPARRTGEPREVAQLIAFLCSDLAGFINGVDLLIDGGASLTSIVLGSRKALGKR